MYIDTLIPFLGVWEFIKIPTERTKKNKNTIERRQQVIAFVTFISFLFITMSLSNSYLSFCFIASFAFVLQRNRAKPIPLCRAVPWCRRCLKQNFLSRREQAPALRCNPIITQIGRENNLSAEILLLRTVEDACPYKCCVKHPYENQPKARLFF